MELINWTIKEDRHNLINLIKDESLSDLIFDNFKNILAPKELAIYFVKNKEYSSQYYESLDNTRELSVVVWCLMENRNINLFNIFIKKVSSNLTLEICVECLKLTGDLELLSMIENYMMLPYKEQLISKALAEHDLKTIIDAEIQEQGPNYTLKKYIFQAYEANFIELIKYISTREVCYFTLLDVLKKQHKLFDLMLPFLGHKFSSETFICAVALDKCSQDNMTHVLSHDRFKFYTTAEGILNTLKFENKCLFKQLIENPSVSSTIIDKIIYNLTSDQKDAFKILLESDRCNQQSRNMILKLMLDDDD